MILLVTVISAALFLPYSTAGIPSQQDEQAGLRGKQSTGAKLASPLTPYPQGNAENYYGNYNFQYNPGYRPPGKKCPLCDKSVYPYCGEKLLHDACCCSDPYIHDLPYQCKLADCRFLHANSCREHRLIANCCCNDDYRSLLKSLFKQ
ncbi:hypothetical protein KM043_009975 [Ampulex compressa]|nr:hypothetical protein KM043_009975 [Ampulex compressa]